MEQKKCPKCDGTLIEVYKSIGGFPGHAHIHAGRFWVGAVNSADIG